MTFKQLSIMSAALMLMLCLTLLFAPVMIFTLFGIEQTTSAIFLSHRAAVLFLGLALFVYSLKETHHSLVKQSVCLSMTVMMLTMAGLGLLEFIMGHSGGGIFLAIMIESVFGLVYFHQYINYRDEARFWGA